MDGPLVSTLKRYVPLWLLDVFKEVSDVIHRASPSATEGIIVSLIQSEARSINARMLAENTLEDLELKFRDVPLRMCLQAAVCDVCRDYDIECEPRDYRIEFMEACVVDASRNVLLNPLFLVNGASPTVKDSSTERFLNAARISVENALLTLLPLHRIASSAMAVQSRLLDARRQQQEERRAAELDAARILEKRERERLELLEQERAERVKIQEQQMRLLQEESKRQEQLKRQEEHRRREEELERLEQQRKEEARRQEQAARQDEERRHEQHRLQAEARRQEQAARQEEERRHEQHRLQAEAEIKSRYKSPDYKSTEPIKRYSPYGKRKKNYESPRDSESEEDSRSKKHKPVPELDMSFVKEFVSPDRMEEKLNQKLERVEQNLSDKVSQLLKLVEEQQKQQQQLQQQLQQQQAASESETDDMLSEFSELKLNFEDFQDEPKETVAEPSEPQPDPSFWEGVPMGLVKSVSEN